MLGLTPRLVTGTAGRHGALTTRICLRGIQQVSVERKGGNQVERAIRIKSQEKRRSEKDNSTDSHFDPNTRSQQDKGSIREKRFDLAKRFVELSGAEDPTKAFQDAETLYRKAGPFLRREARIYNQIIRLALRVGKAQTALHYVTEVSLV